MRLVRFPATEKLFHDFNQFRCTLISAAFYTHFGKKNQIPMRIDRAARPTVV